MVALRETSECVTNPAPWGSARGAFLGWGSSFNIETSERAKHLNVNGISENDIKHTHGQAYSAYCWVFLSGRGS